MVTSREEEVSKVVVHVVLTLFALTFIFGFIKLIRLAGCKILHLATCCKRTQPSTPPPNRSSRTNPPNQRGDRRAQTEPRGLAGHVNRAIFNVPPGGGGERSLDRRGSLPQYDEIFQDKDGSLPPSYRMFELLDAVFRILKCFFSEASSLKSINL